MNKEKIESFEDFMVYSSNEGENKHIEIKLGAFSIIISYFNSKDNHRKLVIDNLYTLSDMQDSVVVFKWLKSFWQDLASQLTVRLIANNDEDDSIYNYEEFVEVINGKIKTIKASCDYYNAWIDSEKNWAFEIDGVRIEKQSNISMLNDFQGFVSHDIVPKEYKDAMKIIIARLFRKYAQIQEILLANNY